MKSDLSEKHLQFQRLLIQAREKAGLSQQELADRLGRHQTYVSKCERGERRMDVLEFLEVMKAVGSNPIRLIKQLVD
jgi:ribosome-binding protein aMBF1 (putative translation factor)